MSQKLNKINNFEVLLINPSSSKGYTGRGEFFTPPMGLAYLASFLKYNGISVDLIDLNPEGMYIDYVSTPKHDIDKLNHLFSVYSTPIVIGIGPITTPFLKNSLAIARYIKEIFTNSFLVIGGPHPSISPPIMADKMLCKFNYIDAVCINEGEYTLLELVEHLKRNRPIAEVRGLVVRAGKSFSFKQRELMISSDLNSLPLPNRDLLEKYSDKYKLALRRNFFKILSDSKLIEIYGKNPKFTVIFSSRGCPYKCTFCCSLNQRRLRDAENVVREIEQCIEKHNIHCFVFYDDLFTTSSSIEIDRIKNICKIIKDKKLKILWSVELRADVICNIGKDNLKLLYEAGCYTVNIGIEKTTDEALKLLNKGITVNQIRKAIKLLRKSGDFTINGTFIFGGDSETENDIKEIISFSKDLGLDYASFYPLEIHPGTKVFDRAKKIGLVDDILNTYISDTNKYPIYTNSNLNEDKLMRLQCTAYREFYFDTNYINSLIKRVNSVSIVYEQYKHIFEHAFIKGVR